MKIKLKALLFFFPLVILATALIPLSVVISSFGFNRFVEIMLRPITAILSFIFNDESQVENINKFEDQDYI